MIMRLPLPACLPKLYKRAGGRDATDRGAFLCHEHIELSLHIPRELGAAGAVLRLIPDGGAPCDLPFAFCDCAADTDVYTLSLDLRTLCGERGCGLFYYEILFLRGRDTLFSNTCDNLSFTLSPHSAGRFRLLVSRDDLNVPAWICGGVIYHVFVDRFARGAGTRRAGAHYHEDWNEEIEQFGAYPGAPVANDEFFGGTLDGVRQKLDYLASLGVTVLYLSPIFLAASNHKYDTGDYEQIDPQFGGEEAFVALVKACRARGIRILLDGVFNHTGADSKYFNQFGNYPTNGAYNSPDSPFANWYFFEQYPDRYTCWWGVKILPKLNLSNPAVQAYFTARGGIVEKYLRMGADGWRLDVADELPDAFLDELHARTREVTKGEGLVLGEVWENAADKIAYGKRRRYFQGGQLDSVMNYPVRNGIIAFVRDRDAAALAAILTELWASYPRQVCHALMNLLSTHDTERILTVLGGASGEGLSNATLQKMRMSASERARAGRLLRIAAALQYTVFGVPSVFYGDEAGLEGYHDPFCRRPFPWGREDTALQAFYRRLGELRKRCSALSDGDFALLALDKNALVFSRKNKEQTLVIAANRGDLPFAWHLPHRAHELLTDRDVPSGRVEIPPDSVKIWRLKCSKK